MIDHSDAVGWPATATRVIRGEAPSLHGPFFPATERRLECREANEKWLLVPGNRDKARKSKAAHKARLRATKRTLAAATDASTPTTPGVAP